MTIKAERFEVDHNDFNQVYAIIDGDSIHISSVDYNFNITLDTRHDMKEQLDGRFRYGGDVRENEAMKAVILDVIDRLEVSNVRNQSKCNLCGNISSDGIIKKGVFFCLECADYIENETIFTKEQVESKLNAATSALSSATMALETNPFNEDMKSMVEHLEKSRTHYAKQLAVKNMNGKY